MHALTASRREGRYGRLLKGLQEDASKKMTILFDYTFVYQETEM